MGSGNSPHILTLVNSIIGVSILAMPYCYKQCGIVLATSFLILINFVTRLSCHYLLKSAIMIRRKNFEFLAFHAFGSSGKTVVELSIILLMIGTCIAFFVVMGDLGPAIIGSLLNIDYSAAFRPAVLIGLALFVVLPLGMLRNVDSLSFICTLSFLFYLLLVLKVFIECFDNIFLGQWLQDVNYWRPAGIMQCLPIFSMALSCQTQLFEVFDSVGNATLDRMNMIVKYAVNICTGFYIGVGFFGYIAYYKGNVTGNLLMSFSESIFSEIIKLLFVLSVAVTFPLVIFPCRASLYSLLFKKAHVPHYELVTGGGNHIPETQFKCITLFIITVSLIVGLLAPNIEIVLGLIGSTIGVIICLLFPPLVFIWISGKATTEKALAQIMCMFGLFIMFMGTYANLYLSSSANNEDVHIWKNVDPVVENIKVPDVNIPIKEIIDASINKPNEKETKELPNLIEQPKKLIVPDEILQPPPPPLPPSQKERLSNADESKDDKRIEPPIPEAPEAVKAAAEVPSPENKPDKFLNEMDAKGKENSGNAINKEANPVAAKLVANQNTEVKEVSAKVVEKMLTPEESKKEVHEQPEKQIPIEKPKEFVKQEMQVEAAAEKKSEPKEPVKMADEKKVVQKDILDLVKDKPPLPILINSNAAAAVVEKNNAKKEDLIIQRDILGDVKDGAVEQREKRDLYSTDESIKELQEQMLGVDTLRQDKFNISEVKLEEKSGSFVKNVAGSAKGNQTCEKDLTVKVENSIKEEKQNINGEKSKQDISNSISKAESQSLPELKIAETDNNLIIAPLKLSDPEISLDEKLPVDKRMNAAPIDIKPMVRELKSAQEKDNRKK